jgi:SAM-dependent methyltransferase
MSTVIWHDLECGSYTADLPLWRELAADREGPVLDVGCGTGRVALDLARCGHRVVALDDDLELVAELRRRAKGLPVDIVEADARSFSLETPVALAIVPMQTAQLLGGAAGRERFLRCARDSIASGGQLAIAICDALEATFSEIDLLPAPDMRELDGIVYSSRPLAVVDEGSAAAIHRLREIVDRNGAHAESSDVTRLDRLDADELEAEGLAAGFSVHERRAVPATDEYVASEVVILGG